MLISLQTAALAFAGVLVLLILAVWLLVRQPAGRRVRLTRFAARGPALILDGWTSRCHVRRKWHPLAARRGSPERVSAPIPEGHAGTVLRF